MKRWVLYIYRDKLNGFYEKLLNDQIRKCFHCRFRVRYDVYVSVLFTKWSLTALTLKIVTFLCTFFFILIPNIMVVTCCLCECLRLITLTMLLGGKRLSRVIFNKVHTGVKPSLAGKCACPVCLLVIKGKFHCSSKRPARVKEHSLL